MNKSENTIPFHTRLTPGTPEKLNYLAEKYGINKTSVINLLINKQYRAEATEDEILILKAQLAKNDMLGEEESAKFLESLGNANG